LVHATGALHVPLASQVWTPFPLQSTDVGVQLPTHAPLTHAWFVQAAGAVHWPVPSQICTEFPLHCFWVGAQTPVHTPPMHV
jgi:hypothetical protein